MSIDLKILKTFEIIIPKLTELEKEKLLSFGEGLSFSVKGSEIKSIVEDNNKQYCFKETSAI